MSLTELFDLPLYLSKLIFPTLDAISSSLLTALSLNTRFEFEIIEYTKILHYGLGIFRDVGKRCLRQSYLVLLYQGFYLSNRILLSNSGYFVRIPSEI